MKKLFSRIATPFAIAAALLSTASPAISAKLSAGILPQDTIYRFEPLTLTELPTHNIHVKFSGLNKLLGDQSANGISIGIGASKNKADHKINTFPISLPIADLKTIITISDMTDRKWIGASAFTKNANGAGYETPYKSLISAISIADRVTHALPGMKSSFISNDSDFVQMVFTQDTNDKTPIIGNPEKTTWRAVSSTTARIPVGYKAMPNAIEGYIENSKGEKHFYEVFKESTNGNILIAFPMDDIDGVQKDPAINFSFDLGTEVLGISMLTKETSATIINANGIEENVAGCIVLHHKDRNLFERLYLNNDMTPIVRDPKFALIDSVDEGLIHNPDVTMASDGSLNLLVKDVTGRKAELFYYMGPSFPAIVSEFNLNNMSVDDKLFALDSDLSIHTFVSNPEIPYAALIAKGIRGRVSILPLDPITLEYTSDSETGMLKEIEYGVKYYNPVTFDQASFIPGEPYLKMQWKLSDRYIRYWKWDPKTEESVGMFAVQVYNGADTALNDASLEKLQTVSVVSVQKGTDKPLAPKLGVERRRLAAPHS